jgi:DNA modification methylase
MTVRILKGDCREMLRTLPGESVHCVVTSPPYFGLRDYGVAGQIGLEPTPDAFVSELVAVFAELRRVLRKDGTAWLNLGDSYAAQRGGTAMPAETLAGGISGKGELDAHRGHGSVHAHRNAGRLGLKHKDLIGIPWRVAFALQADGWYLRQDIIWSKPNPMPESVRDRCTKAHEYLFLLSKSQRYHYDAKAIEEPAKFPDGAGNMEGSKYVLASSGDPRHRTKAGLAEIGARDTRNKRSVWEVTTTAFADAHFATFPPALIEPCILAGCPKGGTVLDPFGGAGTTGMVADRLGRNAILIELNPEYAAMAERRINADAGMFAKVAAE